MLNLSESNSPFSREDAESLNQLISKFSPGQLQWLSGYLTGVQSSLPSAQPYPAQAQNSNQKVDLTILYGTETGNAAYVAEKARQAAGQKGINVTLSDIADYKKTKLKKEQNLLIVTATHGLGDPPENNEEFYEFLHSEQAPGLSTLNYSVLALGDTSYEDFCKIGKDYDKRLSELGATCIYDRTDCDVDFEDAADKWVEGVVQALTKGQEAQPSSQNPSIYVDTPDVAVSNGLPYSKKNPFWATVQENIVLNGRGSNKETRHVELMLEDSGLTYEPGDALGVIPCNSKSVVNDIIHMLELNPEEIINVEDEELPLRQALEEQFEITTITKTFLERYAPLTGSEALQNLLTDENEQKLKAYTAGRHIIDVITDFPPKVISATKFAHTLRKLPPRLYSIASSYNANPDEAHITVGAVRYNSYGRKREGVASTYIADQLKEGGQVPVYIQKNRNFRLPADPSKPVIMVGPGTGIAPFRAFVEERKHQGATGKNWLFFGDQHFRTDFLYQLEWQKHLKEKVLSKMDVAFSRDSDQKVYVQDRMKEKSKEIYKWLEEGAYFYVCGDAENMAPQVHQTLTDIISKEGGHKPEYAEEYVKSMQKEKRYLKDVY